MDFSSYLLHFAEISVFVQEKYTVYDYFLNKQRTNKKFKIQTSYLYEIPRPIEY